MKYTEPQTFLNPWNIFDNFFDFKYQPQSVHIRGSIEKLDNGWGIKQPLPGVSKDNIDLNITNKVLTLMIKENGTEYTQQWTLPSDVITENIKAVHKDGMLNIDIPIKKPKTISIQIE